MLKGGVAVKHLALEDGRAAYRVGRPRTYGSGETRFDEYGDTHRDADTAVRAAFRHSAQSDDPESIGGRTRLTSYGDIEHAGSPARVQDFTLTGDVVISQPQTPGATKTVTPSALRRRNPLLEALAEEVGKPGTNWKQVKGENRKRVEPLVKHYMSKPHPFAACVADNTKRFGPEGAKKVCAVVKDMGYRSTKWRKGGRGKKLMEAELPGYLDRLLEAAGGDVDGLEAMMLSYVLESERASR